MSVDVSVQAMHCGHDELVDSEASSRASHRCEGAIGVHGQAEHRAVMLLDVKDWQAIPREQLQPTIGTAHAQVVTCGGV